MTVPFLFANASGRVPAAELDVNFAYVANNVATANVVVFSAQPTITSVGTLTSLVVGGTVTGNRFIGNGNTLSNIQGGNVVGAVAYATTANSVTGGNVSGPVAYATTANSVTGANVSGAVALATLANTANAVAGANVSGQVGNALIAATVYTNAQPNITSVGTLSNVSVAGNVRARDFYGISINSNTGNLLVSANVSDPGLAWTFINDYSGLGVASLLGPTADFNKRSEVLLPGRFSTGILTFTGPDYAAFPDSLVIAAGENISIAQTPGGLGNAATYVTTFDTDGNWTMPANVSVAGNVNGNYFLGNGRNLTGILATSSYDNANVTALLSNLGSNVISGTGNITTTANISGNYILGNGSQLTGLYGNANVATFLGNVGSNVISGTGNITTTANISGNYILGNGSQLTGLPAAYGNANVATFLGNLGSNNISTTGNIALGNIVPAVGNSVIINSNGNTWVFNGATGNITIPSNGAIRTSSGSNGNILLHPDGIGTVVIQGNSSGALLTVTGDEVNSFNRIEVDTYGNVNTLGGAFTGSFSRGTPSAPTAVETQDRLAVFAGKGYDGSVLSPPTGRISIDAVGSWSPSNHGTHISFWTTPVNSTTIQEAVRVAANGNLDIYNGNLVLSGGNITGANVVTANTVSTTGNITGANLNVGSGNVNAGNVTAGNMLTNGLISATGNVTAGNILTGGLINFSYTSPSPSATIDLTKQVAMLSGDANISNVAGYTLNNGTEGQVLFITWNGIGEKSTIQITSNLRTRDGNQSARTWQPFDIGGADVNPTNVTLIFSNNYWTTGSTF